MKRRDQASVRGCTNLLFALSASMTSTYSSLGVLQGSNPQRQLLKASVYHLATSAVHHKYGRVRQRNHAEKRFLLVFSSVLLRVIQKLDEHILHMNTKLECPTSHKANKGKGMHPKQNERG